MSRDKKRGWRVGHSGRDSMYYDEWHDGKWHRIVVGGEMLVGNPHHVIYFPSRKKWETYPTWAQDRRYEIIDRIKSEFRKPGYVYDGD